MIHRMSETLRDLLRVLENSDLPVAYQATVVAKLLCMFAVENISKEEFLYDLETMYDFEMEPKGDIH
jgi:hypothetical protein